MKHQRTLAVLVYSDYILIPSAFYTLRMMEMLSRYTPYYVGLRRKSGGISTPPERTILINSGSERHNVQEALFRQCELLTKKLKRQLTGIHPAIVHSQFGTDAVRGMTLSESLRIPHIVHFRGHDATFTDAAMKRCSRLTRQYLRRRGRLKSQASLFIAISDFVRRRLELQGFPPERLVTHYTGIDLEFFKPDRSLPRSPVVLFVGRLIEYKGCDCLIRVMSEVQKHLPELELVIIGDGQLRGSLEKLASSCLQRFRFLGWVPQETVRTWMNRAQLLAFPSVTEVSGQMEGLGNVSLEAQAMGLPVVGHFHGGIPEAVESGKTGLLVQERDSAALAAAILELATNQLLWQRFSEAGMDRVREKFDLRRRNCHLERYYDAVLRQHQVTSLARVHTASTWQSGPRLSRSLHP